MNTIGRDQEDKLLLAQLQDILLREDRERIQQLKEILDRYDLLSEKVSPIILDHLKEFSNNYPHQFRSIVLGMIDTRAKTIEQDVFLIKHLLNDKDHLSDKVGPIVSDHIEYLKQNFPKEFTKVINDQIEQKIRDSQEEILNVITPVLGKLIRKSIKHQFQMLKERIDKQVRTTFSKQGFFGRIFRRKQENESEIILSQADPAEIQEIYVVQRDSGLLLGSASSAGETIDQDVIAGMLTAIKAFVEDAFHREQEELEMIEYDNYKILVQNFYSYYIALAISGSISAQERNEISDRLYDFAEKELKQIPKDIDDSLTTRVSEKLNQHFFNLTGPLNHTSANDQ